MEIDAGSFAIEDLWDREAYAATGEHLGRIEAISMGRDRLPRRVGVRSGRDRKLQFFALTGASLRGRRVVLELRDPMPQVLSG